MEVRPGTWEALSSPRGEIRWAPGDQGPGSQAPGVGHLWERKDERHRGSRQAKETKCGAMGDRES
jgi:hypothetical protein